MYTILILRKEDDSVVKRFKNVESHIQYRFDYFLAMKIDGHTVTYKMPETTHLTIIPQLKGKTMTTFDEYNENASRLTFEDYDDYTLEEMANRLSFKIFECRSMFRTLPKNTRMLYIIAYNETIHEIRRRNER